MNTRTLLKEHEHTALNQLKNVENSEITLRFSSFSMVE